jgi:type IV pilus assembly protein PilY1
VVDSTTDSAWLFFGLRRGGSSYYALDVTYPDSPKLMWHITNTGDFSSLGLTFSKPKVVKSAFNTVTGEDNLVVIFGGGYDTKKDASGPNAQDDDNGAAIYMVSAKTGAHILKIPTNKKNGIASSIASLDSDSDGLVDRLYVGDTGGNVFRVDMPDTDKSNHSIITLPNLGGSTNLDDIRFFNEPSIVRTYILESTDVGTVSKPNIIKKEIPYDAILLGSGDRASPINPDTTDMFFMIKDQYIKTQKFGSSPATTIPTAITLSMLYDYTDDPFNGYPSLSPTQERNLITASEKSGWYYELDQEGEKNSAKAIVINNVVYFTSYSPSADAICAVVPGNSWLYAVDLALGIKKYNWSVDSENRGDRIKQIGYQFLGQPTLISTPVIDSTTNETKIQGNLIVGKEVVQVGFTMQTIRTSLTIPET